LTQRSKEDYAEKQAGPGHRAQGDAMSQAFGWMFVGWLMREIFEELTKPRQEDRT